MLPSIFAERVPIRSRLSLVGSAVLAIRSRSHGITDRKKSQRTRAIDIRRMFA